MGTVHYDANIGYAWSERGGCGWVASPAAAGLVCAVDDSESWRGQVSAAWVEYYRAIGSVGMHGRNGVVGGRRGVQGSDIVVEDYRGVEVARWHGRGVGVGGSKVGEVSASVGSESDVDGGRGGEVSVSVRAVGLDRAASVGVRGCVESVGGCDTDGCNRDAAALRVGVDSGVDGAGAVSESRGCGDDAHGEAGGGERGAVGVRVPVGEFGSSVGVGAVAGSVKRGPNGGVSYGRGKNYVRNLEARLRKRAYKRESAKESRKVRGETGAVPPWRVGAGPQNVGVTDGATIVRVIDATDDREKKKELANTWIDRKIEENVKAAARARADVARMKKDEADGVYDRKREVEIAILDKQLSGELSLVIPRSFKKWAQDAAAVARSVSDSSGSKAKSAGSKIKTVVSNSVGVNSSVSKNASLTDAATMESVVELMDENLALKREIDALKSATERGKVFAGMRAENERLKRENRKLEEGTKILMEQDIQAYNDFCAPMGYDTDDGW